MKKIVLTLSILLSHDSLYPAQPNPKAENAKEQPLSPRAIINKAISDLKSIQEELTTTKKALQQATHKTQKDSSPLILNSLCISPSLSEENLSKVTSSQSLPKSALSVQPLESHDPKVKDE